MGQCWDHVEFVKWTATPFWAIWESESKSVKGDWSPSWGAALRRRGSRQKHIIEGRSSVNEGSMHRSPQLLTPPWVTAKTLYIVLTTFSTLEYEFSLSLGRGRTLFPPNADFYYFTFKCSQLIWSVTHQPTFHSLFNHVKHSALLHHRDLLASGSLTSPTPSQQGCVSPGLSLTLLLLFKIF